jgi:hypothetical protein
MKPLYTLLILVSITVSVAACKKGSNTINNAPIAGKWQETKLRLYEFDDNNVIAHDTTYLSPFTNLDYVQFNSNGTCDLSSDHYYYPNDNSGYPTTPQPVKQSIGTLDYTSVGNNKYVLNSPPGPVNPGGFDIRDTATFIDKNTVLIRVSDYGHGGNHVYSITDSYYTR